VGWIQFHRPEVRNAVNLQMMEELEQVLEAWEKDGEIRVVVLTDVAQFHIMNGEEIFSVMKRMGRILERLASLDKVTVAAVEGPAVGGGCEIAASCDICLASENALFGMIQVTLGITTGWGGGARLIRKIGTARALELLLTGERISAGKAWRLGLVDHLISRERFAEEVQAFAERIAQAPAAVIRAYKQVARAVSAGASEAELTELEAKHCASLWGSEEHHRAVEAFLKRTRT
jgi:enoyl-CoA hydratase/carnithine racemase